MIEIMLEHFTKLHPTSRKFDQGEYLFHLGDRVKSIFIITQGLAQLIRHHENGNAVILQRAGPKSILAEASLFTSLYHCDAIAMSRLEVMFISRTAVQELFYDDSDFAKAWTIHLGKEVRSARLRAEILSLKTVTQKLDAWLADRGALPERGRWKMVAEDICVSPEALYREIARRGS